MPSARSSNFSMPSRTRVWSSTINTRIISLHRLQWRATRLAPEILDQFQSRRKRRPPVPRTALSLKLNQILVGLLAYRDRRHGLQSQYRHHSTVEQSTSLLRLNA